MSPDLELLVRLALRGIEARRAALEERTAAGRPFDKTTFHELTVLDMHEGVLLEELARILQQEQQGNAA